jgi:hypothetical protein
MEAKIPHLPRKLVRLALKHTVGLATYRGLFLVYEPGTNPLDGFAVQSASAVPLRIRWIVRAREVRS